MTQTNTSRMQIRKYIATMGDTFALPEELQHEKERTRFTGTARELAKKMAGTRLKKASVRGLESLAWSTDSVGDILDYIRIRTGRDSRNQEWGAGNIGAELANLLEELYEEAAKELGDAAPEQVQALHLELCREFIKHLVAYFEFALSGGWEHD